MDEKRTYELFKLEWMTSHGYTLEDLIDELEKLRKEAGDPDADLKTLFADWEYERGFGSEIWPCFEEYMECEYKVGKVEEKPKIELKDVLHYVLEDDDTEIGGTAFQGETVLNLLSSLDNDVLREITTIEKLNEVLIECGILPIKQERDALNEP